VHIEWGTLAAVAVVAAAAAVSVVLLVALALVGLSARGERGDRAGGVHPDLGTAIAVVCVAAAGLIVCFGLYVIIA
jgi:hypothetical protein